jgi:hypothetical protein
MASSMAFCSGVAPAQPSKSVVVKPLTLTVSVVGSLAMPAVIVTASVLT